MDKHYVGTLDDIDVLGARKVMIGELELAIFRLSTGELAAIENRCPHKGGKLSEGIVCGKVVHCPLHDWRIDLKNGMVQEPDTGCVPTYRVEVEESTGSVYVVLGGEVQSGLSQAG